MTYVLFAASSPRAPLCLTAASFTCYWCCVGQDDKLGYYAIKFFHAESGQWVRFVIDDYFPTNVRLCMGKCVCVGSKGHGLTCFCVAVVQEGGEPLFGHSRDAETWCGQRSTACA